MGSKQQLYWQRRVVVLAGPVILTNISIPLLGLVDTAVVGRLPGPEFLAAVAIGAMIISLMFVGTNFLRMGTTGLTAQSMGARDGPEVQAWLYRAALIAVGLGLVFILLQMPVYAVARQILAPSEAVDPLTQSYFQIRIWGAPFAMLNLVLLGWFFGIQDTRAALITQVFLNGTNIVLDILFVLGFGWGVDGVAVATLIAEISGVSLGVLFAARRLSRFGGRVQKSDVLRADRLKRMFAVNRDIFLRTMMLKTAFLTMTAVGSRMGDATLAANVVLLQFQIFMAYALDGFATAAESLVGAAKGARSRRRFDAVVKASMQWAAIFAVFFTLVYFLFGQSIINFITTVPSVRETAAEYLVWCIVMPLFGVWSYQFDGIFIGCTWSRAMRNCVFVSLIVFLISLSVFVPLYENHGLWLSMVVLLVARAGTMGWTFRRLREEIGQPD